MPNAELDMRGLLTFEARLNDNLDDLLERHAVETQLNAKESMLEPKHGRLYIKAGGRPHVASAPGEAPAVDTWELIKSIVAEKVGNRTWQTGTDVAHGLFMEFGTPKIAPRPWLLPAFEKTRRESPKLITQFVDKLLRGL